MPASEASTSAMHQVWEKVIEAEPTLPPTSPIHGSFVIPKIVVETQLDVSEQPATITTTKVEATDTITTATSKMDAKDEKQDRDTPEKLLSHTSNEMERHSSDNRQNESISSSASVSYDNSPLMDTAVSIYHYDKQPEENDNDDNKQQQQQHQPLSSVEYELRNFDDMKISSLSMADGNGSNNDDTRPHEPIVAEPINNNNDDKIPKLSLNDRIGEIYRKIEKIEDEYYDEKGKIMENFEQRRLSSTSLSNDEAKVVESIKDEPTVKDEQQEYQANDDTRQVNDDDGNLISQTEWESNQSEYAGVERTDVDQYDSQMDDQSNYSYYQQQQNQDFTESVEQQQQPVDYSDSQQYTQVYEPNQQSMLESAVPSASFEDGNGNYNNNDISTTGDYQTNAMEQYSYEPTDLNNQYVQEEQGVSNGFT